MSHLLYKSSREKRIMFIQEINNNVFLLQNKGFDSNIYLINKQVLIDSGTGFNFDSLKESLRKLHVNIEDIKKVINTHCHFDHVGGNIHFKKAKIALHKEDAPALEDENNKESFSFIFGAKMKQMSVDVKLDDGDILRINDVKLKVIHTPGHTKGSICLYDAKNKILFSGDTIFADNIGRTDLIGGSRKIIMNSLGIIKNLDVNILLPGHGAILLENANSYIKEVNPNLKF